MEFVLNRKRMMSLLQHFYSIVQARVGFYSMEGREILGYPRTNASYCTLIRSCEEGYKACTKCDSVAYQHALLSREVHIYHCHAGLTEVIVPIITSDERRMGFLMIGQLRSKQADEDNWKQAEHLLKYLPVDRAALEKAYRETQPMSNEQVAACAHILQACAAYVLMEKYVQVQNQPLSKQTENYILENLDQPLSISLLTKKLAIGKTTLCKVIRQDFGLTVNGMIRQLRIQKAQQLLRGSTLSVAQVSSAVGITDFNYFTKVFKGDVGVSPSAFRRLCAADHLHSTRAK